MTERCRISWVSCVAEKGGAEVTMLHTFRYLNPAEFEPSVFLLRPGPLQAELDALGVRTFLLRKHRMRNPVAVWQTIRAMTRRIRTEKIVLLHSNGFRAHVYGGLAAKRTGIAEVWTVHSHEAPTLFNRWVMRIPSTQIISNCPRTAESFRRAGCPNEMIWPGVNLDMLEHGTNRETLAAKFKLPAAARWVAVAARLQKYKGQEYFIRAVASLPASDSDVHGIVIGSALFEMEQSFLAELQTLAAQLGVADRIHFTGFIPDSDVAGFLAASDLVVHPALDEDFGLSVAEAQILGRPVLAFAAVGPSAIILPERTGRLVPVGDQPALSTALADCLSDPARLRAWGAAGAQRAREHFGIETHVAKTEKIYRACLAIGNRLT